MIELVDYALEQGLDPIELKLRIPEDMATAEEIAEYVRDCNLGSESEAVYSELAYVFGVYDEVH